TNYKTCKLINTIFWLAAFYKAPPPPPDRLSEMSRGAIAPIVSVLLYNNIQHPPGPQAQFELLYFFTFLPGVLYEKEGLVVWALLGKHHHRVAAYWVSRVV
ncbi:MAG: hypothetical protein LBL76_01680, partial [Treponema sp.]|nr:hypothetical protein [Treponema sp.]